MAMPINDCATLCGDRWRHFTVGAALIAMPVLGGCAALNPDTPQGAANTPATVQIPPLPTPRLSLDEIVALSRQGASSETIINKIQETGSYYRLSSGEIISLRDRGVSLAVIDYLLASERQFILGGRQSRPAAEHPSQTPAAQPRRPIPALYLGV